MGTRVRQSVCQAASSKGRQKLFYVKTNRALQHAYKELNKVFFNGKLPNDVDVRYGHVGRDLGWTIGNHWIIIKSQLKTWPSIALQVLMHEMVHVSLPKSSGHGKQFQKGMLRLAKLGAFRFIW